MHRKATALSVIAVVTLLGTFWRTFGADDAPPAKPELSDIMQQKMRHSQRLLEGLVDQDFEEIQTSADSLLSKGIQDSIKQYPNRADDETYEHFRREYVIQSSKLVVCAKEENLPGATLYYQSLIQTCIACHQHLRDDKPVISRAMLEPRPSVVRSEQ